MFNTPRFVNVAVTSFHLRGVPLDRTGIWRNCALGHENFNVSKKYKIGVSKINILLNIFYIYLYFIHL